MKNQLPVRIFGPHHFSNWVDLFMPRIANFILPFVALFPIITPNIVTISSFLLYSFASILLFWNIPAHLQLAAYCILLSYVADCLDGQLSRYTRRTSEIGNYLDKTLDVLKVYILTISLSYAVYQQTHSIISIFLGFTACFFFNFRYYIKHEVIYGEMEKDTAYLAKAKERRKFLNDTFESLYSKWNKTIGGKLKILWYDHRKIFWVDEGEFVFFTAIAALFNRLDIALWIFAISQTAIALFRLFERGYLTIHNPRKLLDPLRK